MTLEEAKEFILKISYDLGNMGVEYLTEKDGEKMREAVEVLYFMSYKEGYEDAKQEALGQPSDDAISREEAIRVAEQGQIQGYEWQFKELCNLPSVIPQPKMGHWIVMSEGFSPYECSECESVEFKKSKYCPNCGIKMEVEDASNN